MPLEIAGVALEQLTSIEACETARFVRHAVPGASGELAQDLGRPSVSLRIRGLLYGADATERLGTLRGHLLERKPVDFLCDVTGQGYFAQVVLEKLVVAQRAGRPDELDYECVLSEYVPPPPPPASSSFGDLDLGILDEAAAAMDEAQNALAQVAGLADLLTGAADFGNPTTRLPAMLESFTAVAQGAGPLISTIGELL